MNEQEEMRKLLEEARLNLIEYAKNSPTNGELIAEQMKKEYEQEETLTKYMKEKYHDVVNCGITYGSFSSVPTVSVTIERPNNCNLTAATIMGIDFCLLDIQGQAEKLYRDMKRKKL